MSITIGNLGPAPFGQLFINNNSLMCLVLVDRRADGFAMRGGVDAEGVVVLRMVHHERRSVWWSVVDDRSALAHHPRRLMVGGVRGENPRQRPTPPVLCGSRSAPAGPMPAIGTKIRIP
jgi:hypothetical protein